MGGRELERSARRRPWTWSRVVAAVATGTSVLALAGCAGSGQEQLTRSLRDTQAAVRSAALGVELLQRGQVTSAVAQVTAGDMADQIGSVQQQLLKAPGDTPRERELRQLCQVVVADALVAVQDTEDQLAATDDLSGSRRALSEADAAVGAALDEVSQR
jgi:hypothetical protein